MLITPPKYSIKQSSDLKELLTFSEEAIAIAIILFKLKIFHHRGTATPRHAHFAQLTCIHNVLTELSAPVCAQELVQPLHLTQCVLSDKSMQYRISDRNSLRNLLVTTNGKRSNTST